MTSAETGRRVEYRYTFCDLLTRRRLARLPLVDADLSETIGGPADGKGKVPITDPLVRKRDPWAATTPRRTVCFAQRVTIMGARPISLSTLWAGIVWRRERSGIHLDLTMATVESYWARRLIARDRVFGNVDDALMLRTILADAEAVASGGLGITYGGGNLGVASDRTVLASELKKVLEVSQSIAAGGPLEWRAVPTGAGTAADPFGWRVDTAAQLGRSNPPQLTWISDPDGRPGNELLGYTLVEDGSDVPNEVRGVGDGEGDAQLRSTATAADLGSTELADGYPLLQDSLSLSSTTDLVTQPTLDRHTRSRLQTQRLSEVQVTAMTVRGDRGPIVDTYGLGDVVTLRLRDPLQQTPRTLRARIVGRRIVPPQPGRSERVGMTLQPVA